MDRTYDGQNADLTVQKENYNVYAKSFVTDQLRNINKEPGNIYTTPSRHHTKTSLYVSSFAANSFLPRRACWSIPKRDRAIVSNGPHANNYLEYFATIWQTEIAAQEAQNEEFTLYEVAPQRIVWPRNKNRTNHILFAISVPGLREESPHVGLGDTLELRQLIVDHSKNLLHQNNGLFTQSWTGVVYHASVYGIRRAEEIVYLKVDGLHELSLPYLLPPSPPPIVVNVVFPLQPRRINACRDALVFIDDGLDKAVEKERRFLKQTGGFDQQQQQRAREVTDLVVDGGNSANGNKQINEDTVVPEYNDWIRRMLFPVESDGKVLSELRTIPQRPLFDPQVNYEQAQAVNSVCKDDYGSLPYLISGPPGTGKTKTIVETAMQLLNCHITDHILICAPSESAADTLALRLKQYLDTTQLFRLIGPWRADNEVPHALLQYTYMEEDMFTLPPFRDFMAHNIVVTSCSDAAILFEARLTNFDLWSLEKNMLEAFHPESVQNLPKLHWGALLLDEAAQGTELDVLSAISAVCPAPEYPNHMPQPLFIMAGDEKQLGPKTVSRDPQFSMSLFARLFARSIYKDHPLSRNSTKPSAGPPVLRRSMLPLLYPPFTNLSRNYRSHPAILSVPSNLFYNDTLIPEAPTPNTPLQNSQLWQGKRWPVLFIPHSYVEDIERDGGGWFNVLEARLACDTAAYLIRHDAVVQSDICIISPFAAQVKRIRSLMRSNEYGFWDVNIGPLEAFQGLEKRVVIIATTRTRGKRFIEEDVQRGLGLIHQPRKMNVALTRAKEALIVLGSASALREDGHWREFLAFCWRNGLVKDETAWSQENDNDNENTCQEVANVKMGMLERVLLAKEQRDVNGKGRVLGGKAVKLEHEYSGVYDGLVESLREAMDEEEFEQEEVEED